MADAAEVRAGSVRGATKPAPSPAIAASGPSGLPPRAARAPRPPAGFWEASFRRLVRNRPAMTALAGLIAMIALAYSAPLIATARGLNRDKVELLDNYLRPSAAHWFGTDEYGRDYFIRILFAGQISILTGVEVAAVILCIAIPLGLAAGYYGGLIDDAINWVVQVLVTTPTLFIFILIGAWIPTSPGVLALIIGLFGWTGNARQARGLTLHLKSSDYVLAARALGATNGRIMYRHIMPNMLSLMLVLGGFDVIRGIFFEVGLSFLGLGIRPPTPSWGNMLTNSLSYVFKAPYLVVFPGLAVGVIVLCVYTLADGLRDAFDPHLNE